jgi:ABC-2 type transport system ATP-binding protein
MLRIRNLTKKYKATPAVDDLSFEVAPGESLALLGPNGAGKSTTLLCVTGLVKPDAGTVEWDGRVLAARRGQTIALIPETPEVYPMLTVWEHLAFVAASCNLSDGWEERGEALLQRFAMSAHRDDLGGALSKGMRQKTLIAATLLTSPPVLLLDEPLIGLDPAGQRELRELIAELRADGKAIVISTHMLDAARAMSDRALVIKAGRSVYQGPIDSLSGEDGNLERAFLQVTA